MSAPTTSKPATGLSRGLALDIGLPLVAFYGLRALGFDNWVALLVATIAAGVRTLWSAIRARRLNPFSMVMLAVFGVGLALAFLTGDPRLMLLKDSAGTGVIGLIFLITTAVGRPLTLEAQKSWSPGKAEEIDRLWASNADARHTYRVSSLGWGLGLVAEALIRVPLVFLLPVSVMVGLSTAMWITAAVLLITWNHWYIARRQRHAASLETA